MSTTETTNLGLAKPDPGTEEDTWGEKLNAIFDLLDDLVGGVLEKDVAGSSDVTLSTSEAAHHTIELTGTLTGNIAVIVPAKQRNYRVFNNTSGAFTVTVKTSSGSGVAIPQGDKGLVSCDGTDCVDYLAGKLSKTGGTMTGAINEAQATDIASSGSIDLGAAKGNYVEITGTATITALGTVAAGARREVRFLGAAKLAHGTSLLLPGEDDIVTAENDGATFVSLGSGAWWCSKYQRAEAEDPPAETIGILVVPAGVALATGTGLFTFFMPFAMTVTEVGAGVMSRQTSGNILTVDINENGTSILSTKLTIDNNEDNSTTAATPAVISDAALAKGSKITVDIDQIGNGTAKGLFVWISGTRA